MESELTPTTTDAFTPLSRSFGPEEIRIIKDVVARDASDVELRMFLAMAQKLGLDPLSRQIHCMKRKTRQGEQVVESMTITVGIDGYRLVADRTGRYCPGRAPTYASNDKGHLVSATAYVLKLAGGVWHEVSAVAFWDEYAQLRDGKPTALWAKMPRLMLAKCAEALALRRAFPAELSGVYTDDEMSNAEQRWNADGALLGVTPTGDAAGSTTQPLVLDAQARPAPKGAARRDDAWKDELTRLGRRAGEILQTTADLPVEQRQQLEAAVTLARDVFAKNGSSTTDERTTAIAALRQALGASA